MNHDMYRATKMTPTRERNGSSSFYFDDITLVRSTLENVTVIFTLK